MEFLFYLGVTRRQIAEFLALILSFGFESGANLCKNIFQLGFQHRIDEDFYENICAMHFCPLQPFLYTEITEICCS